MSKKHRNRKGRNDSSARRRAGRRLGRMPVLVLIAVAAGLVLIAITTSRRTSDRASQHPQPQADAEAVTVMPASRYRGYSRLERVYAMAGAVKGTLDGLYCYCRCLEHSGHRSLLVCFESDHAAGCDVCLNQAALAYRMARQGASLDEIRGATDAAFARGGAG